MKRFCAGLLALLMILSLAACGREEAEDVISPMEEMEEPLEDVQEPEVELETEPAPEAETEPATEPETEPMPEQKPVTNSGGSTAPVSRPKIPQSEKAYLVRINLTHCTVNIYAKDENGEYTVPLKAMICSTGIATPGAGKFYRLGSTWEWLRLKGNVYGHYVTQITGNILFHSVPYLRWGDPASLEYWEFDKLGVKASQGCIRLLVSDAIWIYNNAWNIVGVEFYRDEDPGPFGKPTAPKISENVACRDWDPTDPNPANPWHSYAEEVIDPETGLPVEGEEVTPPTEGEETPETQPENGEMPEADGEDGSEPPAAEETPEEENAGDPPTGEPTDEPTEETDQEPAESGSVSQQEQPSAA